MNNKSNIYEMDQRWKGTKVNSIEYLEKISSKIEFATQVPPNVKDCFFVIKRLLIFSFYDYEFIDVAFERALSTFELALKIRYQELEQLVEVEKELGDLINWANRKGLFEISEKRIDKLRKLRNDIVGHPKRHSSYGYTSIIMIFTIVKIINGLYDDVELKRERKSELRKANKGLETLINNGAILQINRGKLIIFLGELLYLNNKQKVKSYHFIFYPIFDLKLNNNTINVPDPIIIKAKSWEIVGGDFVITTLENKTIRIVKIKKTTNYERFTHWIQDYKKCKYPLKEEICYTNNEILNLIENQESLIN